MAATDENAPVAGAAHSTEQLSLERLADEIYAMLEKRLVTLLGSVCPLRGKSTMTMSSAVTSGRPRGSRATPGKEPTSIT